MAELTFAEISKLLKYEPETGKLFWLPRPASMFPGSPHGSPEAVAKMWNKRFAGKEAMTASMGNGYRVGNLLKRSYLAHRVAWFLVTGSWPENHIDHINGNPSDNRIENLRDVARCENMRNTRIHKRNTSGHCGIRWEPRRGKWVVFIGGKYIGGFQDMSDAIIARKTAEKDHGYHPNHGRN
jgi:hypothetical protein